MTNDTIMLDDFLMVNKDKIGAIKICDNNPHVLVYISGIANPFRLKHPDYKATTEEQNKWSVRMFEDLQCKLSSSSYTLEDFLKQEDTSEYPRSDIDYAINKFINIFGVTFNGCMTINDKLALDVFGELLENRTEESINCFEKVNKALSDLENEGTEYYVEKYTKEYIKFLKSFISGNEFYEVADIIPVDKYVEFTNFVRNLKI